MNDNSCDDLLNFFPSFGVLLRPVLRDSYNGVTEWHLIKGGCFWARLKDIDEVKGWALRMLMDASWNEDFYLISKAYFLGDDKERSLIMDWIYSEGRDGWGSSRYHTCVEKNKIPLSIANFSSLVAGDKENKIRFGVSEESIVVSAVNCDDVPNLCPWYQAILLRIRSDEFRRFVRRVPLASNEQKRSARL